MTKTIKGVPRERPNCMRCRGMVRMKKVQPMLWKCDCGAVHDEREPENAARVKVVEQIAMIVMEEILVACEDQPLLSLQRRVVRSAVVAVANGAFDLAVKTLRPVDPNRCLKCGYLGSRAGVERCPNCLALPESGGAR